MSQGRKIYAVILIISCLTILASPCFGTIDLIGLGFGLPIGNPCLVSFVNTQGCIQELIASFLSLQVHLIGPQCCKAAMAIDDNCWPKIFPLNPLFPPEIKNYCATIIPLPSPLPPAIPY
ncbi:hypothetical protein M9H77_00852 [Catharanthus roseus]|uniref:Uncharacterized protein n=1 Tax=Catharanthus roseus TaxID=4058 RepID=A0ACC0C3V8_CATRO|nr:hypothetical protein M9H77_00852 [Catharanthus roseus]